MNLPKREWLLLPGSFLFLVPSPGSSVERMMGDLAKADWSRGVAGKEKDVNAIT
jgi:hypothetical protein